MNTRMRGYFMPQDTLQAVVHALLDTLKDTLVLVPFLFLAYLMIEYIEHRASKKIIGMLSTLGRYSPVAGAAAGIVPQCGFSVAAAKLYAGRLISFGTLAAVFIATSDEAIPILLSAPDKYGYLWKLIVIKLIIAIAAGIVIDMLYKPEPADETPADAHDHIHADCEHGECEHGILKPAIKHTFKSTVFIVIVLAIVNIAVALVGEDAIGALFTDSYMLQPLIAAVVGFIPNCAATIVLTELFLTDVISFGAFTAGLITNAGVAYFVLFRSNRGNTKRNMFLVGIIFMIGLLSGYIIQLF